MSKIVKPLPNRRRELGDLLDRYYDYRESIAWRKVDDRIEVATVSIRDLDPTINMDGVAMYLVRYRIEVTRNKGMSNERTSLSTRIPRRGFPTEARAIGYARVKIEGNGDPVDYAAADAQYIGSAALRARVNEAWKRFAAGQGSFEAYARLRAELPGGSS